MGSLPEELDVDGDEFPLHEVTLDAYWIDQTEVTNAMFAQFLNQMGNQLEERAYWLDAGDEDAQVYLQDDAWQVKFGHESHPVVEVTWFGANAYCEWVERSLPSEAQWEKAARGLDGRIYPPGNRINCNSANTVECKRFGALEVGSYPDGSSPYGALDMAGNAWEWVADWYSAAYYQVSGGINPPGPEGGETRVLRGGSFNQDRKHARAANRRNNAPGNSQDDYGFRCVSPAD